MNWRPFLFLINDVKREWHQVSSISFLPSFVLVDFYLFVCLFFSVLIAHLILFFFFYFSLFFLFSFFFSLLMMRGFSLIRTYVLMTLFLISRSHSQQSLPINFVDLPSSHFIGILIDFRVDSHPNWLIFWFFFHFNIEMKCGRFSLTIVPFDRRISYRVHRWNGDRSVAHLGDFDRNRIN